MKYQFNTRTDKLSGARKKKSHQRKPLLQIAHNHKLIPSNNANTGTDMCTTRLLNKWANFSKKMYFCTKFQTLHPHSQSLLLIDRLVAELITRLCNQPKNYIPSILPTFLFTWRLLVQKSAGKLAIETHNHNAIPLINIINSLANTESKIEKRQTILYLSRNGYTL